MRGRVVFGLLLVGFGLGFLFERLGWWSFTEVLTSWWPLLLVVAGTVRLFSGRAGSGLLLAGLGVLLILVFTNRLPAGWQGYVWPLLLVASGLFVLFAWGRRRERKQDASASGRAAGSGAQVDQGDAAGGHVNRFAMFGGDATRVAGPFRGGEATALLGGLDLDLGDAVLPPEGARLSATAVMGGIDVRVPAGWRVESSGPVVFAAVENKAKSPPGGPVLHVKVTAFMGGIEIRNSDE